MIRSVVKGTGSYLPERIVTNDDLTQFVDTSHEWIVKRTGIHQRHLAAEGEMTSDLALAAAKEAMKNASLTAQDIDGIILATTTADRTFPSTAVKVQAELGMTHGFAFDVQAVCSGFVYAVRLADNMIKAGQVSNLLVIGAEKFSSLLDWEDRTTCVLFGDGAGAMVLSAEEGEGVADILSTHIHSDGRHHDLLMTDGGVGYNRHTGKVTMEGAEVFKHATTNLAAVVDEVLEYNNLTPDDIDWLVPHQANARIIETTAKKLGASLDKVIMTVDKHGNTSAASVPLAFHEGVKSGRLKRGQNILIEAMGAGFTWGAALIKY